MNSKTDAQAKAEVAAYRLDRHFDFGLSPPSQFVELKHKTGTFQAFLKGWQEAQEFWTLQRELLCRTLLLLGQQLSFKKWLSLII
ncbi:MAG: hypothetical protein HWD61_08770 [Parachlamydiaceae bacterium]|nr:MAG: hypothetical protein HWD61_08770 [Parachlamydiaceae bacterium]